MFRCKHVFPFALFRCPYSLDIESALEIMINDCLNFEFEIFQVLVKRSSGRWSKFFIHSLEYRINWITMWTWMGMFMLVCPRFYLASTRFWVFLAQLFFFIQNTHTTPSQSNQLEFYGYCKQKYWLLIHLMWLNCLINDVIRLFILSIHLALIPFRARCDWLMTQINLMIPIMLCVHIYSHFFLIADAFFVDIDGAASGVCFFSSWFPTSVKLELRGQNYFTIRRNCWNASATTDWNPKYKQIHTALNRIKSNDLQNA